MPLWVGVGVVSGLDVVVIVADVVVLLPAGTPETQ
jgi:hypothetical protein